MRIGVLTCIRCEAHRATNIMNAHMAAGRYMKQSTAMAGARGGTLQHTWVNITGTSRMHAPGE